MVMSRLDESTLRQIAKIGGGRYVHLDGLQADALEPIYKAISGGEQGLLEETRHLRYVDRYQLLLLLALVLLAGERCLSTARLATSRRSQGKG